MLQKCRVCKQNSGSNTNNDGEQGVGISFLVLIVLATYRQTFQNPKTYNWFYRTYLIRELGRGSPRVKLRAL